jgi:nucleoside-diphosphate-sugar epimerase
MEQIKKLDAHLVYGDNRDKATLVEAVKGKDYTFPALLRPVPRREENCTIFRIIQKSIIPIFGNGDKQTSFCCIQDLVNAIGLTAFSEKAVGISNFIIPLPHKFLVPIVLFMTIIGHLTKNVSHLTLGRLGQMRHRYMLYDGSRAEREHGSRPRISLENGIRCAIEW